MAKAIVFLEIAFGFLIIVRISDQLRTKNLITGEVMTKIVAVFCIWILVWALVPNISIFYFSIFLWIPIVLMSAAPIALKKMRLRQFRTELLILLNQLILKMRAGASFRQAVQSASQSLTPFARVKIEKVVELLTIDPVERINSQHDVEIETVLRQFHLAQEDSHQALPRLCQFREKLKVEEKFRTSINGALAQIKAQAVILTILYLGLLALVISKYKNQINLKLIFVSLILFVLGLMATIWQGRRFRWTV